jgi:hypothetical protein
MNTTSPLLGAARVAVEGFTDSTPAQKKEVYADGLAMILAFVVSLVILAFVGKLLWNGVVVELFTFAKPAKSFFQIVGLMFFIALIRP